MRTLTRRVAALAIVSFSDTVSEDDRDRLGESVLNSWTWAS